MPQKKSQEGDSEKLGRNTRINKSKAKISLEEVPTPVDTKPSRTNPEDAIQEGTVSTVLEHIVTVTVASISKRGIYNNSSNDSRGSESSNLEGKKLRPTTSK